ncbi:AAA family ATPase [Burkholderia pseudomallei]|uniref:AAA family ATPase n=1 Tax=Burkholderia pseudomallei TaxID=28450 RepID=UPI001FBB4451|nr:AAA family ATPase [Burkholderia pseudomallei]
MTSEGEASQRGCAPRYTKTPTCGFCGSPLPIDLWKRLGDHFNQESQDLEKELDSILVKISNEKTRIKNSLETKSEERNMSIGISGIF